MGMRNTCVKIRVRVLALVQAMSVPRTIANEREMRRPESPKTQKADDTEHLQIVQKVALDQLYDVWRTGDHELKIR